MQYESKYLAHHGILGQKWGQRNGPPYPLGAGDHSASEKRAGWKKSLTQKKVDRIVKKYTHDTTLEPHRRGLTESQKKALKVAAATTAAVLASYGMYKLAMRGSKGGADAVRFLSPDGKLSEKMNIASVKDNFNSNPLLKATIPASEVDNVVRAAIETIETRSYKDMWGIEDLEQKIHSLDELPKWENGQNSPETLLQNINPKVTELTHGIPLSDMPYSKQVEILRSCQGRVQNCMFCTTAYELNRRGYQCQANDRYAGGAPGQIVKMFKITDPKATIQFNASATRNSDSYNKIMKTFSDYGDGARGNIMVRWKAGGGHSMAWEVIDGKMQILDCQTGTRYSDTASLKKLFGRTDGLIQSIRTDNAELNADAKELLIALQQAA